MIGLDPWSVLGLEPGAADGAIDAAYRAVVARQERGGDAAAIARTAAAYAIVKDPRARARERLFGPRVLSDVTELADALRALPRLPAGEALWLDALR